jgi:hypothetical protein
MIGSAKKARERQAAGLALGVLGVSLVAALMSAGRPHGRAALLLEDQGAVAEGGVRAVMEDTSLNHAHRPQRIDAIMLASAPESGPFAQNKRSYQGGPYQVRPPVGVTAAKWSRKKEGGRGSGREREGERWRDRGKERESNGGRQREEGEGARERRTAF